MTDAVCVHDEGKCPYHECACESCKFFDMMSQATLTATQQTLASMESAYKPSAAFLACTHKFIRCDSCGCTPIVGPRFSCMVCSKFDLCVRCVMLDAHNLEHPLVLVRVPQPVYCTCS